MAYIRNVKIKNFRSIKEANIDFNGHSILVGDNNVGKTTLLEAIDLAIGPDRLNRTPVVDEHDFYQGKYIKQISSHVSEDPTEKNSSNTNVGHVKSYDINDEDNPTIEIEILLVGLGDTQRAKFFSYIDFWDSSENKICVDTASVDQTHVLPALRVTFIGKYDLEEDDFQGGTYFSKSIEIDKEPTPVTKKLKQSLGFLYLRTLRTGSRALSLERGSLLDIMLRLMEIRPQMWESTIKTLTELEIASDSDLGISPILESVDDAIKKYVPKEWGVAPHLKVSHLTREHLRKILIPFLATGDGEHAAPFYRQGTGTINILVLAMLSEIAKLKKSVIFAMEEPEIAIPPYTQKRIVDEIINLTSQAIFTSHSPYVMEEFNIDETIILENDMDGILRQHRIDLPYNIKQKQYDRNFRTRFCEALIARRVLVVEGDTEYSAFPVVARHLAKLNPSTYSSLEALGICTLNAGGDGSIPQIAELYKNLGKDIFALCDNQTNENKSKIEEKVDLLLMHHEKGFEDLVLNSSSDDTLLRFYRTITLPPNLSHKHANLQNGIRDAMEDYFEWGKGRGVAANFLSQCNEEEIPDWIRNACVKLKAFYTEEKSEDTDEAQ